MVQLEVKLQTRLREQKFTLCYLLGPHLTHYDQPSLISNMNAIGERSGTVGGRHQWTRCPGNGCQGRSSEYGQLIVYLTCANRS